MDQPSTYIVRIYDDATGHTLRIVPTGAIPDVQSALVEWGRPVGTAWRTGLEIWDCMADRSERLYPHFSAPGK